uniref:Toxin candidate TRINITY_DN31332_c0_g1_i1.p1 n=1 Tax=Pachycerianthus borealis TaxID=2736680 RepID=A0A7G7WYV3_9CNID|nr:toxin candidate TRINITY_DN31332_c0_g1_i1.p1 [Pachycerianthus borealis]
MITLLVLAGLCAFGSSHPLDDVNMLSTHAGKCEPGWTYGHKYCYSTSQQFVTWQQAQDTCVQSKSVLAVVKNDQQGNDVLETQKTSGSFAYWIGVKYNNGQLEFTDGKPSTYTNWAKDKNKPTDQKRCVHAHKLLFGSPLASWKAASCDGKHPFTCQKRALELGDILLTYKTPLPNNAGITMVCDIDYPIGYEANFDVEWYVNGALVKTERVKGKDVRESYLKSGHSWDTNENEFKAGDTLQCKVKACFGSTCTPQGTQESSNDYYVGMKVEPANYFELDECSQKTIKLKLVPTVPIRCTNDALTNCNDFETEYGVLVPVQHDSRVVVSDCTADFMQNEDAAASAVDLEVVPVCDNVNGNGDEFQVIFGKITTTHPFWKGYQPEPVTIKLTDKNTEIKQCYCNDDPHCKTLDGIAYDYHGVGTYVMYRNNRGNNEVQIKTYRCGGASCTCATAVRYDGVAVVMDACSGAMNYFVRPNGATLPKGMHVQRNCGGHNCRMMVITPNGNKVTFNKNGRWHQLYVDAHMEPGKCKTEAAGKYCGGLCGKFNGNSGDDFYTSYGQKTSNLQTFGNSWRINDGDSYFNKDPAPVPDIPDGGNHPLPEKTCKCYTNPPDCEYNFNDFYDPLNAGAEDITEELEKGNNVRRRSVSTLLATYKRQTRSTISHQEATTLCDNAIFKSDVGKACKAVKGFTTEMNKMKANCIFDLKTSGEHSVIASTVDLLIEGCQFEAIAEPSNRVNGKPPIQILGNICEGDCNGHGQCHNGKCTCDTGFTSQDCSISLTEAPTLDKDTLGLTLCDKSNSTCESETIFGSGFLKDLTCHLTVEENIIAGSGKKESKTVSGHQTGVLQIKCQLPAVITPAQIEIAVSNDGILKSTNSAKVMIYNSQCQQCDVKTGKCILKANTCNIGGECYNADAKNPLNDKQKCKPNDSQTSWTEGSPFELLGCFKDKKSDRALSKLLKNLRPFINWKNISLTIKECAKIAQAKNYKYFAIQYFGECWSDDDVDASKNYKKYGPSTETWGNKDKTKYLVGKSHTNCVYKYT